MRLTIRHTSWILRTILAAGTACLILAAPTPPLAIIAAAGGAIWLATTWLPQPVPTWAATALAGGAWVVASLGARDGPLLSWSFGAMALALIGWDLQLGLDRARAAPALRQAPLLFARHFRRSAMLLAASAAVALLGASVPSSPFNFDRALILALLLLFALSGLVRRLRGPGRR